MPARPARLSLGAVVENTSTLVAYRTRVTFRVFDARHQSVVPPKSGELLHQEIPVILPGQRIGLGSSTYVGDDPVFRNSDGALVGGDLEVAKTGERCRPGKSTGANHAFRSIPPGIDDSRTESYPYCDLDPADSGATGPDTPIN